MQIERVELHYDDGTCAVYSGPDAARIANTALCAATTMQQLIDQSKNIPRDVTRGPVDDNDA